MQPPYPTINAVVGLSKSAVHDVIKCDRERSDLWTRKVVLERRLAKCPVWVFVFFTRETVCFSVLKELAMSLLRASLLISLMFAGVVTAIGWVGIEFFDWLKPPGLSPNQRWQWEQLHEPGLGLFFLGFLGVAFGTFVVLVPFVAACVTLIDYDERNDSG